MEELLTPQQLAALLQVSVGSIRELCRHRTQVQSRNPLPHFKIHGKAVRFRRSDVEQWLAACVAQSAAKGRS
jgi:excisionase family DNA binding protein